MTHAFTRFGISTNACVCNRSRSMSLIAIFISDCIHFDKLQVIWCTSRIWSCSPSRGNSTWFLNAFWTQSNWLNFIGVFNVSTNFDKSNVVSELPWAPVRMDNEFFNGICVSATTEFRCSSDYVKVRRWLTVDTVSCSYDPSFIVDGTATVVTAKVT